VLIQKNGLGFLKIVRIGPPMKDKTDPPRTTGSIWMPERRAEAPKTPW
jgi:hypothetical protein